MVKFHLFFFADVICWLKWVKRRKNTESMINKASVNSNNLNRYCKKQIKLLRESKGDKSILLDNSNLLITV